MGIVLVGVVVGKRVFLQVVRPGEALAAVVAPVFPLPCVYPEMSVELVRPSELPGAARPRTKVGLITDMPPQMGSQVGGFLHKVSCSHEQYEALPYLVDLATVGVVAEVHGGFPGGSVGVHTQRTPALLALPSASGLQWREVR